MAEAKMASGIPIQVELLRRREPLRIAVGRSKSDQHRDTGRDLGAAECLQADAYINVQGDEPFISPAAIDAISEALEHLPPGTLAVNARTPSLSTSARSSTTTSSRSSSRPRATP